MNADIVDILGVPTNLGADNLDVAKGPAAYRHNQFAEKLTAAGFEVKDVGDVAVADRDTVEVGNPALRRVGEVVRVSEEIAKVTEKAMRASERAVVLGGDHSVCLGAVSGATAGLQGTLGLIYFDAHGDMCTQETTRSGNIHGMQLAALMGFGAKELASVHGEHTKIAKENVLHIGGCDFDQAELDLVKNENVQTFSILDLLTKGLGTLLPMIDDLAARVDHLWVSLDLDAIDAQYAPGAGMPNKKGLVYREIISIAEYIGKTNKVVGVDVVEYSPAQDEEYKTAELATELTAAFLGKTYNWYEAYMSRNKLGREGSV